VELFNLLKKAIVGSSDIHVNKISSNSLQIQELMEKIDIIIGPFENSLNKKIEHKKLSDIKLNADNHKINTLLTIIKQARATLKEVYYEYESIPKEKHMADNIIENDSALLNIVQFQSNTILLLKRIYDYLKENENILKLQVWDVTQWDSIMRVAEEIYTELRNFSKMNRRYVELNEEIRSATVSLVEEIMKNYKKIFIIFPNEKKPALGRYYTNKSERELMFLKYVPVIDFLPYNHEHSERTELMMPLHEDNTLPVLHYNLEFKDEINVHIIPKEYLPKFNKWIDKYRYVA
jgi:hypothetical protein